MKLCEIIKEILVKNNLSQQNLADILNVSQKTISNWLNDVEILKKNGVLAIYEKFGITPNELYGLEEPKNFKLLKKTD